MPEMLEVETYRVLAEQLGLDRPISAVNAPDTWILKGGLTPEAVSAALIGRRLAAARRRGKLLMLDTDRDGPTLGLRFGMTGRLVVDGDAAIDRLLYAPPALEERWERFGLVFSDGGTLRLHDPRRLGGVFIDPDEDRLGPDAASITLAGLAAALGTGQVTVKARLLDQSRVAGIGNLIVDEILWRASLSPLRPVGSLSATEVRRLHRHLRTGLAEMAERGGSHMGDLGGQRRPGGHCPKDGAELVRATAGGRTSWWCPKHQR